MYKINEEMMNFAEAHRQMIEEDYQKIYKAVGQSNAVYKGKQLPFLYYPSVYSQEDVKRFEALSRGIYQIVNRSIEIFFDHPEVRSIWGFNKQLEELILLPQRFSTNVPMGRFDFFYYPNGHYMFCELNTDGTSAMNEETPLTDILMESYAMGELSKQHEFSRYELYHSWVDEVEQLYGEFLENGGPKTDVPYVIIMDFVDKGSPHEFKVFESVFEQRGFKCDIVSPDQLTYSNGRLYYKDQAVDIIYRRLVTRDMMDHYDELQALIQGIKANQTCIIGSIRSQIVHTKKYFEALYHPSVRQYFTKEELTYIDAHIPFTTALVKDEHFEKYVKEKDNYIIKPIDLYASKGVYAGKEFTEDEWRKKLEEGIATGYIIQYFCEKSQNKNLHFNDQGQFEVKTVNNITGLFLYNEKVKGIFTRAGFNAVISDLNDGYSLSSIVVK